MVSEKINESMTAYGSKNELMRVVPCLTSMSLTGDEGKDRLIILNFIENHRPKVDILYKGNTVWDKKKLLKNFRSMVKSNNMGLMTKYTYEFLHLSCGSIAHFNKYGWIAEYPTIAALRDFFRRNEFGENVLHYQPRWKTDAIEIVKEINKILNVKVPERR